MCLVNEFDNSETNVELKFTNHFKPMYGITVHKAQGMTIDKPYSIYEYDRMAHDMLYVSLTRTQKKEYVNFCKIDLLKPYVGYIYRYSFNGKSYIGSTNNIKKRKEAHKTNNTNKFGRAIKQYGYTSFEFEVLEKINYSDKTETSFKFKIFRSSSFRLSSSFRSFNYLYNYKATPSSNLFY